MQRYTHNLTPLTDTVTLDATLSRLHRMEGQAQQFRGLEVTPSGLRELTVIVTPHDGGYRCTEYLTGTVIAELPPIRRALLQLGLLSDARIIADYLPQGYKLEETREGLVIAGHDFLGWTLDGYVLPRLASGLWAAEEIDGRGFSVEQ
jgi:hypothetical protein